MTSKETMLGAVLGAIMFALTVPTAMADGHYNRSHEDHYRGHSGYYGRHGGYHGSYGNDRWREGHWVHGLHDGGWGWWWVLADGWYFYPQPIYPYPAYVPPVVVQPEPRTTVPQPSTAYWYYCGSSHAYYPYVKSCSSGWQRVPTTPSGNPPRP